MKKEDFYTIPKSNSGVKMPLSYEDGTDSGEWLLVRGTDSEYFRKARFEAARMIRDLPESATDIDRVETMDAGVLETLVSLIAGWSFEEECTPDAVREFMMNAPQIANAVDRAAADRSRFFGTASDS